VAPLNFVIDIELKFNFPLDTKEIILGTLFRANLLASDEQIKSKFGEKKTKTTQ